MTDIKLNHLKKVLSTTLVITLLGFSFSFGDDTKVPKDTKLMPSGEVVEMGVRLKYPIVANKLNRNKTLKQSDILVSIKLAGEEIIPNRQNIEKLMKSKDLPLEVTCYRNEKFKSMDITSDDLRDFEFGYFSFPNRQNIEKLMKSKDLPLEVTCYRNEKFKSMDITSDDLRDFEFGYFSFYLGTITAVDSQGNFIGLSHNLKDEEIPFDSLDNVIFKTSYVQTSKNTVFRTGYLVASSEGDTMGKFTGTGDGGISGKFENYAYDPKLALEIGTPKEGTAYLYCKSPVSNELKMHEIKIVEVGKEVSEIKIIDKDLLKYRGGIVQGMSGTPIIQDNKIVGGTRAVIKYDKSRGLMTNIDYMLKNSDK